MITFYPRDFGMWRKHFWFNRGRREDIFCIPKPLPEVATFHSKDEFFDFLKSHGVKMNDPTHPLRFVDTEYCKGSQAVVQWTCLGWVDWV